MKDPYISTAGNTFEKKVFFDYVTAHHKDPFDGTPIEASQIMPNLSLKYCIESFLEDNPWAFEYNENDSIENLVFP
jgi:hypothetical protein